jgi:hypothetical protein
VAFIGGAVRVDEGESVSKSGLAGAIFERLAALNANQLSAADSAYDNLIASVQSGEFSPSLQGQAREEMLAEFRSRKALARLSILQAWARTANELGPPVAAYVKSNLLLPVRSASASEVVASAAEWRPMLPMIHTLGKGANASLQFVASVSSADSSKPIKVRLAVELPDGTTPLEGSEITINPLADEKKVLVASQGCWTAAVAGAHIFRVEAFVEEGEGPYSVTFWAPSLQGLLSA